ncbi:MAG: deoxynucleoside kinase [Oscillospiraceae bacterium]|nr:deoxynucleoside kinase [Oscillospiraceae bacterium]
MSMIVIDGLDGSGKATQSRLLADNLQKMGVPARRVSFPDYDNPWSCLVKMYLGGEFGKRPEDVGAFAASSFFAMDRYASFKKCWEQDYLAGTVIVADRYVGSNAIHQMSKLPREEWDGFLDWLWDYEYQKLALPRPDLVLYLDMSPETSRELLKKRYGGDESKKDIHEKDFAYLMACRESARYVAQREKWRVIPCCDGKEPLPVEEIGQTLLRIVLESL